MADESPQTSVPPRSRRKELIIAAIGLVVGVLALVIADFATTTRITSISATEALDAYTGQIVLRYSRPVAHDNWMSVAPEGEQPSFTTKYSEDGLEETLLLGPPTVFNHSYELVRREPHADYSLFGWFRRVEPLAFQTAKQKIDLEELVPAEAARPAPETLNNQLVLKFTGDVLGKQQKGVNIPQSEMKAVRMTTPIEGYWRWSSARILTFNFSSEKPQFETTYAFEISPTALIDDSYQAWAGAKTKFAVTTSTNEVYVTDFSLKDEAHWQDVLRIEFSGVMIDALEVLKKHPAGELPVTTDPPVDGTWAWSNARTLEFHPDAEKGWPIRETVTVTIAPAINKDTDRKWRPGKESVRYKFKVVPRPQAVESVSLSGESVALDDDLVVRFSRAMVGENQLRTPMDSAVKEAPLAFKPSVSGRFVWTQPDTVRFRPTTLWPQLTEINVGLAPGFGDDKRFEWTGSTSYKFKTVENLVSAEMFFTPEDAIAVTDFVRDTKPYLPPTVVAPESHLWLRFTPALGRLLDESFDVSSGVKITPEVKGKFRWLSPSVLEFASEDRLPQSTDFKIKLTDKLFTHPEQHFADKGDTFSFKTAEDAVTASPAGDQGLPPDQEIHVTFSKNVSPGLAVGREYHAAEINSQSPVQVKGPGDLILVWDSKRALTVRPAGRYFVPEADYVVSLGAGLMPHKQTHLSGPATLTFHTTKNLVTFNETTPQGQVSRSVVLDATFNKRVRPDKAKLGAPFVGTDQALFKIEPPLPGTWAWVADDKVEMKPDQALAQATEYTVTFDPNQLSDKQFTWSKRDAKNEAKAALETFTFHTPALHVESGDAHFEFNPKNLLQQRFFLEVALSVPVKEDELRKRFSIWYDKPGTKGGDAVEVPLIYKLKAAALELGGVRRFTVESDWTDRPDEDRRIHYKIAGKLAGLIGNLGMESDYTSDFLQEKVKYITVSSVHYELKDRKWRARLSISAPVEPETLHKYLKVFKGDETKKPQPYELEIASSDEEGRYDFHVLSDFESGETYHFELAKGMLATDGAYSAEESKLDSDAPELDAEIGFDLPGEVLSARDLKMVGVRTVNHDSFRVQVHKVHASNLRFFANNDIRGNEVGAVSKLVHDEEYPVDPDGGEVQANEPVVTHLDLSKLFAANARGLYQICIGVAECEHRRWFVATDIGLFARRFGASVVVWAHSLHTGAPLAGVQVAVADRFNQDLATGVTREDGSATLSFGESDDPALVVGHLEDDLSFVSLAYHRQRLVGEDIEGVGAQETSVRSFLYSERGVYRPGETVHLVAVTRGKNGALPPLDLPATFSLMSPLGQEAVNERYKLTQQGLFTYDFMVPTDARTGKWTATVNPGEAGGADPASTYTFQVEEFVPNKIKVELELLTQAPSPGDKLRFRVKGQNLFGPPAAGNDVSGAIELRATTFRPKGFEDFAFGHDDVAFKRIEGDLDDAKLGEDGAFEYGYEIPSGIDSPSGLTAFYQATVLDDGGRGVAAYGHTDVLLYHQFVGLKRLSRAAVELGEPVRFRAVNVDAGGVQVAKGKQKLAVRIFLSKPVRHYRKNERGYFRFVDDVERILAADLGDPRDPEGKITYAAKAGGDYLLEVEDLVGGQKTRQAFSVIDGSLPRQSLADLDKVLVKPLGGKVDVGGVARVEIQAPFAGRLILVGEREKVLFTKVLMVDTAPRIVELPVEAGYLPNFYVTATLLRPVPAGDRTSAIFASGIANVNVTDPGQAPKISIETPDLIPPGGKLTAKITVDGGAGTTAASGGKMYFTIAAVDVGILDLTDFKTPDMRDHFNRKQRLEVQHVDMYHSVMPYDPNVKRTITPSGDTPVDDMVKKKHVNPESQHRFKSVALWSGVAELSAAGTGEVTFDVPQFEGRLRVMGVTFGDQRFASAAREVTVRDRLVVKPSWPRFAATGDEFVVPVSVFNDTGEDGEFKIGLEASGHFTILGAAGQTLALKNGKSQITSFTVRVMNTLGLGQLALKAAGGGTETERRIDLPVRSPGTYRTFTGAGLVDAKSPRSIAVPHAFLAGTEALVMRVASGRMTELLQSLAYLLRYPHGCLEQVTSKAFPMLHYEELAIKAAPEQLKEGLTAREIVKGAIAQVEQAQLENGRFRYWSGSDQVNEWVSIYASHFLVEARKAGYKVSETTWTQMIKGLTQIASTGVSKRHLYEEDGGFGMSHYLYALYVLAIADQDVLARLNQVLDTSYEDLREHDKARLAASFKAAGQPDMAKKLLASISVPGEVENRNTTGELRSRTRDLAIVLDAVIDIAPTTPLVGVIIEQLAAARGKNGSWPSTHDNALALLALGKAYAAQAATPGAAGGPAGQVTLGDGTALPIVGDVGLGTADLTRGDVRITANDTGAMTYAWEASGIETDPAALLVDQGLKVRRRFLDAKGEPMESLRLRQGDLVVVELTVQTTRGYLANVAVTDLLPMGLEVENARLATSTKTPWLKQGSPFDHLDVRDDRVNLYINAGTSEQIYYYTARAVTVGTFQVPSVSAEAMYDPDKVSRADSGHLVVTARDAKI